MSFTPLKEAAEKIDKSNLKSLLVASNEHREDKKLMELADFFGRAFSEVNPSFPWVEKFSSVSKNVNTPVGYISEDVKNMAVNWIKRRDAEALVSFALWALYSILANYTLALAPSTAFYRPSIKSEVALFAVLGLVLRAKPDVLVDILPTLKVCVMYQGQDKLPLVIWIIGQVVQAPQKDVAVGLYAWTRTLLPIVSGTAACTIDSKRLISLIVDASNARMPFKYAVVREGERSIPPDLFDMLMRVRFSAHLEGIHNIKAVYPALKEIALASEPGSEAMEQVSRQIFQNSLNALVETLERGNNVLFEEASGIMGWCLTKHEHCYELWEKFCDENNVDKCKDIRRKLSDFWEEDAEMEFILENMATPILYPRSRYVNALTTAKSERSRSNYTNPLRGDHSNRARRNRNSGNRYGIWSIIFISLCWIVNSIKWSELLDIVMSWIWDQLSGLHWDELLEKIKSNTGLDLDELWEKVKSIIRHHPSETWESATETCMPQRRNQCSRLTGGSIDIFTVSN